MNPNSVYVEVEKEDVYYQGQQIADPLQSKIVYQCFMQIYFALKSHVLMFIALNFTHGSHLVKMTSAWIMIFLSSIAFSTYGKIWYQSMPSAELFLSWVKSHVLMFIALNFTHGSHLVKMTSAWIMIFLSSIAFSTYGKIWYQSMPSAELFLSWVKWHELMFNALNFTHGNHLVKMTSVWIMILSSSITFSTYW